MIKEEEDVKPEVKLLSKKQAAGLGDGGSDSIKKAKPTLNRRRSSGRDDVSISSGHQTQMDWEEVERGEIDLDNCKEEDETQDSSYINQDDGDHKPDRVATLTIGH